MEETFLTTLQSINGYVITPFWLGYDFLLGIINVVILAVTLCYLIKYTKATEETKNQIEKQTDLEQMPILALYIRSMWDYNKEDNTGPAIKERLKNKFKDYLITINGEQTEYFFRVRNMGKGVAFDIEVESDKFNTIKYQSRFLAPLKDEQSIAITGKTDIKDLNFFKDAVCYVSCKNVTGSLCIFSYKIRDIKDKRVEYLAYN
ncbi:MAG: hypothetical protein WC682_05365 [Parcubacteria group bacterium]